MKNIKQFSKIFLALLFLTSCRSSINDLTPIINSEDHIDKNNNLSKLGDINFWVNSKAYNHIENVHQILLLSLVDLIIGKTEYPPN